MIERLSLSDALYHTAEHTALVTLVAQDILRGRRLRTDVPPDMWLHVVLAALTHDVGYLRGICQADTEHRFVANEQGDMIELPRGASDAALAPYHVIAPRSACASASSSILYRARPAGTQHRADAFPGAG